MAASAPTIRKIRTQFEEVLSDGAADCISFGAMDIELSGGTLFGRNRLRSVAVAAGRAIDRAGDADGFETWVALLRERQAELSDEGLLSVSVPVVFEEDCEHCDVALSQIDPPLKSTGAPSKVAATEAVQLCRRLEADQVLNSRIDPKLLQLLPVPAAQKPGRRRSSPRMGIMEDILLDTATVPLLLYSSERAQDFRRLCQLSPGPRLKKFRRLEAKMLPRLIVEKVSSGRYTVIDKHDELYEAYRTLGNSEARCAVQPTTGAREVQINLFCQASIKLCKLLEAEAFEPEATSEKPSAPGEVRADDTIEVVARNIESLRRESGLSYEQLAKAMGMQKRTVMANAKGRAAARPETLKLYADEFTDRLGRNVSVAKIRGETDA